MKQRQFPWIFLVIVVSVLVALGLFLLMTPRETLAYRWEVLLADIRYALNPPAAQVFVPSQGTAIAGPPVTASALPPVESETPTLPPTTALPEQPSPTPTETLPPPTLTPLPAQVLLTGIRHSNQMMNNCGPANLAMALSFWGWRGDQRNTAAVLKPNKQDKNVMPYEMEAYVEQETGLQAVVRVGGTLQDLQAFVAAGFPVIAEKGYEGPSFQGWMGHYQVVNGYDQAKGVLIVQDSYSGPNIPVPEADFLRDWRAFNYTYLVIYPPERQAEVVRLLGLNDFDNFNYRTALQLAEREAALLQGRDLFFALFNIGASQVSLKDYAAAAAAFDSAFANYALLSEAERPWRMLWYQTGPYFAYYFTGRYQDVIDLATTTLEAASKPLLEESFYWRGRARLAIGEREAAVADLRLCLEAHPGFTPCVDELRLLGLEP